MRIACRTFEIAVLVLFLFLSGGTPLVGQQSPNFSMDRISVVATSNASASVNFETAVVIGQDSPSGASSFCSEGFVNSTGFWSVLGDLPVPTILEVGKDSADQNVAELSWSGTEDVFQLYSSNLSTNIFDPANLTIETATCSAEDSQSAALIFYSVIPKP